MKKAFARGAFHSIFWKKGNLNLSQAKEIPKRYIVHDWKDRCGTDKESYLRTDISECDGNETARLVDYPANSKKCLTVPVSFFHKGLQTIEEGPEFILSDSIMV